MLERPSPRKQYRMSDAGQMLDAYPRDLNLDARMLTATLDALIECAQACTSDADADLSEGSSAARPTTTPT